MELLTDMCPGTSSLRWGRAARGTHGGEAVVLAEKRLPAPPPQTSAVKGVEGGGLGLQAKPNPPRKLRVSAPPGKCKGPPWRKAKDPLSRPGPQRPIREKTWDTFRDL